MSEDMTAPVTRGELEEILSAYATRIQLKELLSAYPTRIELKEELVAFGEKLKTELRVELGEDIARHMKAGFEEMRKLFGVLDAKQLAQNDQHTSLARRVDRLEVAVFDPPNPKP